MDYYAVCKEKHQDGGDHYHTSFNLTNPKRWGDPKIHLMTNYNVVVNFRELDKNNCMYAGTNRYVCKEDPEVFHSPGHPPLDKIKNSRTNQCIQAYIKKRKSVSAVNPVEQPNESKMKKIKKEER